MVKIRLTRTGTKKIPRYRIVAIHSTNKRDGRVIENLGTLNPCANPPLINLKMDRVDDWISKGAQPTVAVKNLIKRAKKTQP